MAYLDELFETEKEKKSTDIPILPSGIPIKMVLVNISERIKEDNVYLIFKFDIIDKEIKEQEYKVVFSPFTKEGKLNNTLKTFARATIMNDVRKAVRDNMSNEQVDELVAKTFKKSMGGLVNRYFTLTLSEPSHYGEKTRQFVDNVTLLKEEPKKDNEDAEEWDI